MALCGLQAGFTWSDIKAMSVAQVAAFVEEWAEFRKPDKDEEERDTVRDATQADIEALKRL